MSYDYQTERAAIFTELGVEMLLKIRDRAFILIGTSGAAREAKITGGVPGDSWAKCACVQYLVERGELYELTAGKNVVAQHRIYSRHGNYLPPVEERS